jgi:diaminohydroxyphosphoribosylaminopyrimidine deaminase/5-amino-6-(5-phosphoribosylamino)uracil reductase
LNPERTRSEASQNNPAGRGTTTPNEATVSEDLDHEFMARALRLARRGLYTTDPNPRVGCVLTRDGKVVGEGWHRHAGEPHAEILALRAAGDLARGADCYVTLEPCNHQGRTPPCTQALIKAGVGRVVAAMQDPNPLVSGQGLRTLEEAGIPVRCGVLEAQAKALNPGFIKRMVEGRPLVRCKLAMSLDGRTAMASGESRWISGEAARRDVQRLRARSSAILTGIGTVLADDPSMTVRRAQIRDYPEESIRQPLRVVVDPHLSIPAEARILHRDGNSMVATAYDDPELIESLSSDRVEVVRLPGGLDQVDLQALLSCLAEREINEVLLETGATLSGAMLRAGLIDELVVYMAPSLMGDAARGLFHLPGLDEMAQRVRLKIDDIRAVGEDWRISARILYPDEPQRSADF